MQIIGARAGIARVSLRTRAGHWCPCGHCSCEPLVFARIAVRVDVSRVAVSEDVTGVALFTSHSLSDSIRLRLRRQSVVEDIAVADLTTSQSSRRLQLAIVVVGTELVSVAQSHRSPFVSLSSRFALCVVALAPSPALRRAVLGPCRRIARRALELATLKTSGIIDIGSDSASFVASNTRVAEIDSMSATLTSTTMPTNC